jgi:hypothetical protein
MSAQYPTLQKYFSQPSFSYLLSSNLTHKKLKLGLQIDGRTTNSKALGQIIMIGQSKQGAIVKSYLLISYMEGDWLCCAFFTSLSKLSRNAVPKRFC